jgi:hypothetical protein
MITAAAKLWFGVAALALVAAVVYAVASGGEWYGTFVLGTLVFAAAGLGTLAVAVRDGDVAPDVEAVVPVRRSLPSAWPALTAVGAGTAAVGLAGRNALLYVGFAILAVVLVEWMVQSWAERATGDHAANQTLRNRIMYPLEIPALAAIGIALVVLSFSRVMLALPKTGSTVVAIVLASAVLAVAALLTTRPRLSSSVLTGIVALGAIALVAGGVVGAVVGEREFEHHGVEEHASDDEAGHGDDDRESGNNPSEDEGGEDQSEPGADAPAPDAEADADDDSTEQEDGS